VRGLQHARAYAPAHALGRTCGTARALLHLRCRGSLGHSAAEPP